MPLRTAVLLLSVLLASSCGGGNSPQMTPTPTPVATCEPASPGEFAYALNGDVVSMYTVDSCTGSLTASMPATVATGSTQGESLPEDMVADPAGRFAYVANLVSNAVDDATISMYTINPSTGVLTPTTPATVPTGFLPQGIAIDPSGKFVYTANSDDNTVSMFTINQTTGTLTPTEPPTIATGWSPGFVTVDPSGRFVYVSNQDDDTISMYTISPSTGILTPTSPATVPTGFSPFGVTVDPSGKFAYVPNTYESGNNVSQYIINSVTGVLTPDTPSTAVAGNQPTAVAVDPSSRFAYAVNRLDNTISLFSIDPSTGNLTAIGTAGTGGSPFRIGFDPSGKFVYVANESSAISIYSFASNGMLTPAGTATTENGGSLAVAITGSKPKME
jgi:6-phosphogluconolactonase